MYYEFKNFWRNRKHCVEQSVSESHGVVPEEYTVDTEAAATTREESEEHDEDTYIPSIHIYRKVFANSSTWAFISQERINATVVLHLKIWMLKVKY